MHTNEPRELEGVELGYDPRDIDQKRIYKIVVYFFLFALFFFGVGAIVFTHFGWGAQPNFDTRKAAFGGPKVQGNIEAKVDIMNIRQEERHRMESYEQREDGSWRIPVEAAIDKIAERGLPTIASGEAAVSKGNTIEQNATGVAGTPDTPAGPSSSNSQVDPSDLPTRDPGMSAPAPPAGDSATGHTP